MTSFQPRELSGTTIDFSFDKLSKDPVSSVVKSYSLVPLETNENFYLSRIQKVEVADHRIFVLNNAGVMKSNVLQFSEQGQYLGKLDRSSMQVRCTIRGSRYLGKRFYPGVRLSKNNQGPEKAGPQKGQMPEPKLFKTADKLDMTSNPVLVFVEFVL
ncbi:MAG: 6-bladed beta-propeller [Mangrovibacterium sp.]